MGKKIQTILILRRFRYHNLDNRFFDLFSILERTSLNKASKYTGNILLALGILHVAVGLFMGWSYWQEIFLLGFYDSIEPDIGRSYAFWFTFMGLLLLPIGILCNYIYRINKSLLPKSFGWAMLLLGSVGAFFVPVSGFWLFIALGIWLLIEK